MLKRYFSFILSVLFCLSIQAQKGPEFLEPAQNHWVDSVFSQLTVEEKVGQLLMPRGNVSGRPHDVEKLMRYVKDYHIGGIVFFAGPPTVQARLTNQLQNISRVPLLIGEDFEWGLAMRMDSTDRFPYNMSLGAINGKYELIEEMGAEVGRQCKRLGVHVNYAPVVDVNININNPVINFRSYGEDKNLVAQKGLAYMKGLQSQNIIATAKHFPGHGDTDVDSHKDLPIIPHSKERLKNIEFVPFQKLIDNGLAGVMTSHLDVPVYEAKPGLAATFSKSILTDLLKNEMGFTGLTFTDAMDMQGAVKNFPKGEALVEALLAGNDVLETFEDVPSAFEAVL
ncbi:MAG: glycoside hydrolase family 3 N-terminal domain-containing protein, partial [Saprospiraceae bacterium]